MSYLLLVDPERLLHIGHFGRANWESLDLDGGQSAQVPHRFDVSCPNKLPKTTRPVEINSRKSSSSKLWLGKTKSTHYPRLTTCWKKYEAARLLRVRSSRPAAGRCSPWRPAAAPGSSQKSGRRGCNSHRSTTDTPTNNTVFIHIQMSELRKLQKKQKLHQFKN